MKPGRRRHATGIREGLRGMLLAVGLVLVPVSCGVDGPAAATKQGTPEPVAFSALIEGAYDGEVSGAGVLRFLQGAGSEGSGYYFLADAQGIRPHGVTFVLPHATTVGRYELSSPRPFDIGTVASVRVDRDMGDSVVSSDRSTTGFINLTSFPPNDSAVSGAAIEGNFQFEATDSSGRSIMVAGEFAFEAQ